MAPAEALPVTQAPRSGQVGVQGAARSMTGGNRPGLDVILIGAAPHAACAETRDTALAILPGSVGRQRGGVLVPDLAEPLADEEPPGSLPPVPTCEPSSTPPPTTHTQRTELICAVITEIVITPGKPADAAGSTTADGPARYASPGMAAPAPAHTCPCLPAESTAGMPHDPPLASREAPGQTL